MDLSLVLKITLTIKQSTLRVKFINNTIQKNNQKSTNITQLWRFNNTQTKKLQTV
jgi:hypothetical protein